MSTRKERLVATLEQQARAKRQNKLRGFEPYPKQREFMALGATHRERCLMAATQVGKSEAGAAEMAYHLTGDYPNWWLGRRFNHPVQAWTGGESTQAVRSIQQTKLLGPPGIAELQGTGFLPKDKIVRVSASHGVADSADTVTVKHTSGGMSQLVFKSYEMRREKWQGASLNLLWLDEEPPIEIYAEALSRITATGGLLYMTFTPLLGVSEVVGRFLYEPSPDRAVVGMGIDDALHIPEAERARIVAGYLPHEREARAKGIPMLGAGKIFQTPEDQISIEPFEPPPHWFLIWGCDFGVRHPAAFVLLAYDRDQDVVYVVRTLRMSDALFKDHARSVIQSLGGTWARNIPVAWPQDGTQRREFEGELRAIAEIYRHHGLRMLPKHATEKDGSISTEAGVQRLVERFATGKLKVFNTCTELFDEYRTYHRDTDGKIVKERDDVLSALRTGVTMLRAARNDILFDPLRPNGRSGGGSGGVKLAIGANPDPYGL